MPPRRSEIEKVARDYQQRLLRRERHAANTLVKGYGPVYARIQAQVEQLTGKIEAARARGQDVRENWLLQRDRLHKIEQKVLREVGTFANNAGPVVQRASGELVTLALRQAHDLVDASMPDGVAIDKVWGDLNERAVRGQVAMGTRGPLRVLLDDLGPAASADVRSALVTSVALGRNPRATAREVRSALGGNLNRALLISRSEQMRSYRQASQMSYAENRQVVPQWIWYCALDSRTCPVCWAMHGSEHDSAEMMGSHPACRCTMVPKTASWSELGIADDDERLEVTPGADLFDRLTAAEQRAILGKAKFNAFAAGDLKLADTVRETWSGAWGLQRSEASLVSIVGPTKARQHRGARAPRAYVPPPPPAPPPAVGPEDWLRGEITNVAPLGGGVNETLTAEIAASSSTTPKR